MENQNSYALTLAGQQEKQIELLLKQVELYSKASIIPKDYQGEDKKGNCLIALDMAMRMGVNPLAVMQNLYVVNGRPTWSSAFLISTINACGRFTPLRYEMRNDPNKGGLGCRCVAWYRDEPKKDESTSLKGSWITMKMAELEGWSKKAGSKWLTMPEQMLRYRAAAFWQRAYAPEISMGFITTDEARDGNVIDADYEEVTATTKQDAEVDEFEKMQAGEQKEFDYISFSRSGFVGLTNAEVVKCLDFAKEQIEGCLNTLAEETEEDIIADEQRRLAFYQDDYDKICELYNIEK